MAARRTRKGSNVSDTLEGQHGVDKLRKRKELFIQQFEKEAHERVNEMEAKLDKLLATVDRAYKIEMMKLPQSFHTTLIKDLMKAQETSVGEVTMAIAATSPEISKPLSRKPSKKGKSSTSAAQQTSTSQNTQDGTKRQMQTRKMKSSNSTGSLRGAASTVSSMRTNSRVLKVSDQALASGLKARKISRSLSEDLSSSVSTLVTTSLGETLLLSEENKEQVELELLDELALSQICRMKELMEYFCDKVQMNKTH